MRTLEDAWTWYDRNRKLLIMMNRLGTRYWEELPWAGTLGNDDHFRLLTGEQIQEMAQGVLEEFDDLAVFVIFSVFESIVRRNEAKDLETEVAGLRHPVLQRSAKTMLRNLAEGSFYNNVLELFKRDGREPENQTVNSLVEEVSRVRRYRNWVAHGRKATGRLDPISPRNAYDTLQAFLSHLGQAD